MNIRNRVLPVIIAVAALLSCSDELVQTSDIAEPAVPEADVMINGDEQYLQLDADPVHGAVVDVCIKQGDFLLRTKGNRLYFEQNDDHRNRLAELDIVYADGHKGQSRVMQGTTRSDAEFAHFQHNYGVGYSYNGLYGKRCSLDDVRCQILNRAVLEECMDDTGEPLINVEYVNTDEGGAEVYYTKADYLRQVYFNVEANASCMLLFSASASADMGIAEDGKAETYTLRESAIAPRGKSMLDKDAICYYTDEYPHMLTSSFRHSVEHLQTYVEGNALKPHWELAVDSFLNTYGSHVVTSAVLGGRLDVELELSEKDYWTYERKGVNLQGELLAGLVKASYSSEAERLTHLILNDCKCQINVVGGDVTKVDALTAMNIYKVETLAPDAIKQWQESVTFSEEADGDNNSELIDMNITPIWDFIADQHVSDMVQARVENSVDALIRMLGNRNFINTSFRMPQGTVSVPYIDGAGTLHQTEPSIINIIRAGRHVASICKELIPEIDDQEHWVVYPIYEGKLLMESGLCALPDGTTYTVCWNGSNYKVQQLEGKAEQTSKVYITAGVPLYQGYNNIRYEESHWMPDIEMQHSINLDGTFNTGCRTYDVWKHFGHFYLRTSGDETHQALTGIPGWSFMTDLPAEYMNYPTWFDAELMRNRMVRDDEYRYIYNPKEARVAE